jgi:hypothetical protein
MMHNLSIARKQLDHILRMRSIVLAIWTSVFITSKSMPNMYTLHDIDTKMYPDALCLDGSPAAFWYRPGYGDGSNKVSIIQLI